MAETARAKADEQEFFDEEDVLNKKVSQLAELIMKSKHCVVFTGGMNQTYIDYIKITITSVEILRCLHTS